MTGSMVLQIRTPQLQALAAIELADRLHRHVEAYFPDQARQLGVATVAGAIEEGINKARRHGFTSERDIGRFINLMFVFGRHFDVDPRHVWARPHLGPDPSRSASERMQALYLEAMRNEPSGGELMDTPTQRSAP